jgi:8-oxo-dGTP diphosphatase
MKKGSKQTAPVDFKHLIESLSKSIAQLSVDCVVFGFHDNELKVLVSKYPYMDLWVVQGGFVQHVENVDDAAKRILAERTGLDDLFLQQFHTFGNANRPTLDHTKQVFRNTPFDVDAIPFLKERFITIGYYALVDYMKVTPVPAVFFERIEWCEINNLPNMAFDHADIITKALETLRQSLDHSHIGFKLMPDTFTMNELQKLYETILGEPLSRNNFQRKILEMNVLERLEKKFTGEAHKAPYLYRLKQA